MGRIRPFVEADIPDVAALRLAAFRLTRRRAIEDLAAYMRDVFLHNPWRDDELPSLVYEDGKGRVAGFVGVIPRRMAFRGRPLRVVVSTQFMVDPAARGIAGVQLVQKLFAGPQDLTLGDAAPDLARRIWVGLGGRVAPLHSLFWTRPLHPLRFAAAELGEGLLVRALRLLLRPLLNALDAAALRIRDESVRRPPRGTAEALEIEALVAALPRLLGGQALYPVYEEHSLRWLLAHLGEIARFDSVRRMLVRDADGEAVGWFLYAANPGGVAQVVHLGATERSAPLVLRHLFHQAWRDGAVAVAGRLDPPLLPAVLAAECVLDRGGPWVLVQSRRLEILRAIERGDAWITGLDGERWLSF